MKLSEYKNKSDEYTGKASEITRQLTLAGIAIIWLFKVEDKGRPVLDSFLLIPLITLCIGVIFDLLQYVIAGIIWKKFYKEKERLAIQDNKRSPVNPIDPETHSTKKMTKPIYFLYTAKIILLLLSYLFILVFLFMKIKIN